MVMCIVLCVALAFLAAFSDILIRPFRNIDTQDVYESTRCNRKL